MEGSKTDTVKVPVQKYRDGQKYRCIVTDKNGKTVTSAVVAVKVAELPAGLAIVSQPVSVNAAKGTMTEFKVQAIGEGLTYQWEYCNASSNKWRTSSMEGNQTDTIKVEKRTEIPLRDQRRRRQYADIRCSDTDGYPVNSFVIQGNGTERKREILKFHSLKNK